MATLARSLTHLGLAALIEILRVPGDFPERQEQRAQKDREKGRRICGGGTALHLDSPHARRRREAQRGDATAEALHGNCEMGWKLRDGATAGFEPPAPTDKRASAQSSGGYGVTRHEEAPILTTIHEL